MPKVLPTIKLSHGQVAWVLCEGEDPPQTVLDRLTYLRQRGVPFADKELGKGKGNPVVYGFMQLAECGLALEALRRGTKPGVIAACIASERSRYHRAFKAAYLSQPDDALDRPWVRSRGRSGELPNPEVQQYFVRLPNPIEGRSGEMEIGGAHAGNVTGPDGSPFDLMRGINPSLILLGPLLVRLAAWAREVPEIKAGRPG